MDTTPNGHSHSECGEGDLVELTESLVLDEGRVLPAKSTGRIVYVQGAGLVLVMNDGRPFSQERQLPIPAKIRRVQSLTTIL